MSRELTPAEYALDAAIGLMGDWLSQGYPAIDHECLDRFPGGCPRCEKIRIEMARLMGELRKGEPAIKSLIGAGHVRATQVRECVAMPGMREQSICTPGYLIDPILRVWDWIALDPCSNPESIVPADLNCILAHPGVEPKGGGAWLVQSGLEINWPLRTYCNPPWGELEKWLAHGIQFQETIWLVPMRSQRGWFQDWLECLDARILLKPVRFLGFPQAYPAPCMMGYKGCHANAFNEAFRKYGRAL